MDSRAFLSLSLSFLLLLVLFPHPSHSSLRRWLTDKETHGSVLRLKKGTSSAGFDPTRVTQLSWSPRAFIYRGLLSHEECDHLVDLAKDKLEKSMVADNESGKSIESEVRTSSGMFLKKAQDEVVAEIEARLAAWTFLPEENGESIQILHYENGQKYEPHFDYFHDKANQELGGHRVVTVLMYLSDVERGGETIFPNSEAKMSQPKDDNWSDCAKNGYAVKPMKGDALLFFSLHPDATTDPNSLHGSCPVIEGEKWSATKWIHVRSFDKSVTTTASGDCVDENENCPRWAKEDEEDAKILAHISNHGIGNWTLVPKKAGLNRCGKSCRLRWTNYLRPDLKHDNFTPQEELLILELHKAIGSRWSLIAKQLPGRTDNDVKNYWNTKLRKKLGKMGIDPITHKPFSQILSDFGNIRALTNPGTQIGSLNRNSNNTPIMPLISEATSSITVQLLSNTNIIQRAPTMQQFHDNNLFNNNNASWDFQSQFQVNNQETIHPNFISEITSSSSSSSSPPPSSSSTVQIAVPSSPFSWSEFLQGDPFLSTDLEQQESDVQEIVSSNNSSILMQNEIAQKNFIGESEGSFINGGVGHEDSATVDNEGLINRAAATNKGSEASSSSSVNSFVEAILDRDSEMCSEFLELFDESFEY